MTRRTIRAAAAAAVIAAALPLLSCGTLGAGFSLDSIVGTVVGAAAGNPEDQATLGQLQKTGEALGAATEEITPEQEYYIGRTVAATVLASYKPWDQPRANDYLTTLARALALDSALPETFSGWHVLVLDSDEINAFGAPSGFILVSRGLLRCAASEDEVAAIIAHEVGHVSLKHGLSAISTARWTEAGKQIAIYAGSTSGSGTLRSLTNSFGDVVGDIAKTMITSGYSRDLEKQADLEAVRILRDLGYDPSALVRVLTAMQPRLKPGAKDFTATHPDPETRIAYVREAVRVAPAAAVPAAKQKARRDRWQAALGKV